MLSVDEITAIKDYYTNKKRAFANRTTYYSDKSVWGDTYGFDLSEPYTIDEIEKFESYHKIQLDPSLKIYLTQISKEIFVYAYPIIFYLSTREKDIDDDSDDLCVVIGNGGCSFTDVIYLNGDKAGTIWYDDSDSMMQCHDNFKEYITKELIREKILKSPDNKQDTHVDFITTLKLLNLLSASAGIAPSKYSN